MSTSTPRRSLRRTILRSPPLPSQSLGCSRGTVRRVVALYKRADRNKDGTVDLEEFARTFDVERGNPYLPRLVALFDLSGDGEMGVFEFVVCLSQFRETGTGVRGQFDEHVYFAWRLFDTDDDGGMTKEEFKRVMGATYFRGDADRVVGSGADRKGRGLANFGGVGGMAKGLDNIMREVDVDGDGQVTIREFARMLRKYKHMMAPAFDLWDKLSELSQPCTAMYREIKAAGNVQKLIDLAMMQSEERAAKGGRFEDVGTRSDPRASSPRGCRCLARKEQARKRGGGAAAERDTKDTSIPTPAEVSRSSQSTATDAASRVETKGGTSSRRRGDSGRVWTISAYAAPLKPRKSSRWNARSRRSTRKDEPAEDANRRGDGGRRECDRRWEGTRAEDGGDGNAETET